MTLFLRFLRHSESPKQKPDTQPQSLPAPKPSTSTSHARTEPSHVASEASKPDKPKQTIDALAPPVAGVVVVNGKGKGKAAEVEIDWSDWHPQAYIPRNLAELRFM